MSKNKIKIIVTAVLALIVLASVSIYLYDNYKKSKVVVDYNKTIEEIATLNIIRTDLTPEQILEFKEDFAKKATTFLRDPEDVSRYMTLLTMGATKKEVGDYKGAEQAWLWASKIQPNAYPPYSNLGYLYFHHFQDFEKAEQAYLKVIDTAPMVDVGYFELYQIYRYFYKQDSNLAESILIKGIENNPLNNGLMSELADYYKDMSQKDKAIEWYNKALEIEPNDEHVRGALADI